MRGPYAERFMDDGSLGRNHGEEIHRRFSPLVWSMHVYFYQLLVQISFHYFQPTCHPIQRRMPGRLLGTYLGLQGAQSSKIIRTIIFLDLLLNTVAAPEIHSRNGVKTIHKKRSKASKSDSQSDLKSANFAVCATM